MKRKKGAPKLKILVTGFDPFNGQKINPAIAAVKKLPDQIAGAEIIKLEVPTIFNKCAEVVHQAIIKDKPDCVLSVGQAGGRPCLTLERVAINLNAGRAQDNAGYIPHGEAIQPDGAAAYLTQLPLTAEVQAIKKAGLPAMISNSAGTYVCNHLMYQVQYMRAKEFPHLKAGFIHVPLVPAQAVKRPRVPSMSLPDMVTGLTAAIKAIVQNEEK